jgi:hypothetical protein
LLFYKLICQTKAAHTAKHSAGHGGHFALANIFGLFHGFVYGNNQQFFQFFFIGILKKVGIDINRLYNFIAIGLYTYFAALGSAGNAYGIQRFFTSPAFCWASINLSNIML